MPSNHPYQREIVIQRLRQTITEGKPIVCAGSSCGLIAKSAQAGGADLIIVYSTGRSRLMGLPTTVLGDSNDETLKLFDEISNVVSATPIVGGAFATDPTYMDLDRLLDRFQDVGYSGIINFPNVSTYGDVRGARMDDVGLGISREFELVRLARERNYLTMAYVYTPYQARRMAEAGVDIQVAHVGWTVGGMVGRSIETAPSFDEAAEIIQEVISATRAENPHCICLAHGGPYDTPEHCSRIYSDTDAVGFVGASSIERIPVERAVKATVEEFKSVPMARRRLA